jgi:hypothetical protein
MKTLGVIVLGICSTLFAAQPDSIIRSAPNGERRTTRDQLSFGVSEKEMEPVVGKPTNTRSPKDEKLPAVGQMGRQQALLEQQQCSKVCVYNFEALVTSDGTSSMLEVFYDLDAKSSRFAFKYGKEIGFEAERFKKRYPPVPDSFVRSALSYFAGEWTRIEKSSRWVTKNGRLVAVISEGGVTVWRWNL